MSAAARPRVLCVDDEPLVLEGLQLHLRRRCELALAGSGEEGLAALERGEPFDVVISDMRMPGMDGAAFLARARARWPDTTRVLLTGHADLDAAQAAVNEGQIFRFLTKPCPPEVVIATVEAGAAQRRLVVAERVLLEQTLAGAVRALVEVLALASPVAFGRAARLHRTVAALCERLDLRDRWPVEVAAQLSQLGSIQLPPALAEKLHDGRPLEPEERAVADRAPELAERLLANIPRLEPVREILAVVARRGAAGPGAASPVERPLGARLLELALELDRLEGSGLSAQEAIAVIQARPGQHERRHLEALAAEVADRTATEIREVPLAGLLPGMVLAEDLRARTGLLLVARGHTVSAGMLSRLQGLAGVREPVRVVTPRARPGG